MPVRTAEAEWNGGLMDGRGRMAVQSEAFECPFGFGTRFGEEKGTNPEELIGAAHAGCFSMAFSAVLGKAGFAPKKIQTRAKVHLEKVGEGFAITKIDLSTEGEIPEIDEATFRQHAEEAKASCPVSKALAGAEVALEAKLL